MPRALEYCSTQSRTLSKRRGEEKRIKEEETSSQCNVQYCAHGLIGCEKGRGGNRRREEKKGSAKIVMLMTMIPELTRGLKISQDLTEFVWGQHWIL